MSPLPRWNRLLKGARQLEPIAQVVIALAVLILAGLTAYWQFFDVDEGVRLTPLMVNHNVDRNRPSVAILTASFAVANIGDRPIIISAACAWTSDQVRASSTQPTPYTKWPWVSAPRTRVPRAVARAPYAGPTEPNLPLLLGPKQLVQLKATFEVDNFHDGTQPQPPVDTTWARPVYVQVDLVQNDGEPVTGFVAFTYLISTGALPEDRDALDPFSYTVDRRGQDLMTSDPKASEESGFTCPEKKERRSTSGANEVG